MRYLLLIIIWLVMNNQASADPTYQPAYSQADATAAAAQYQASMATIVCTTCAASAQVIKAAELARWIADCNNPQLTHPVDQQKCVSAGQIYLGR